MKRILMVVLTLALVASLALGASSAMAAKPQSNGAGKDVIAMSNGFPSGPHFNLNIHGKKDSFTANGTATGGSSIFVLEYGNSTIQYVTNRKSSVTELTALDKYAEAFDGDPAVVQVPYDSSGYFVFGRILAKPQNGKDGDASSVILYPASVVQACNANETDPNFGNYTNCDSELALGLIVGENLYTPNPANATWERFDPGTTTGKGRSKAIDITRLFTYTGWVISDTLDLNGDGAIDFSDVPLSYDLDADGIEQSEFDTWLAEQETAGLATYHENEWILNIADLVVAEQDMKNNGTKLLQIRFYPVATTEFNG